MSETARLQRSVSRWRAATVAAFGIQLAGWLFIVGCSGELGSSNSSAPVGLSAAAKPQTVDEIRCRRFVVVDDKGRETIAVEDYAGTTAIKLKGVDTDGNDLFCTISPRNIVLNSGEYIGRVSADEIVLSRQTEEEMKLMVESLALRTVTNRTPAQHERLQYLLSVWREPTLVKLGTSETNGGNISIFNPLGEQVATLQSNKSNEGGLYLSNSVGETKKAIAAD